MINSISSWARVCFSHRPARPAIAETPEGICQLDNPNEARGTAQRHQGPDVAEPRLAPLRWLAIPPDIAPPGETSWHINCLVVLQGNFRKPE